ncbi:putative secreted protein [Caldibacillus thermoamylovorans]|uniref:Putative secreted protein n=1 Tax=Caldibacillus thermoamylovorans TaxID=35841 RepID=A0A090IVJ2_9BACI|nr:YrrS family protein [Caldibacillus thermoamylovorans]MCM3054426.1 YrrS family protein [Caldibacillus thermoamylovorans]CEE02116.1 putative secreted protein [Caldibacillus thermoamylovorans]
MANNNPQSRQGRRKKTKQQKQNLILNISIAIVFILIISVGWSIIASPNNAKETAGDTNQSTETTIKYKTANKQKDSKEKSEEKKAKENKEKENKEAKESEEKSSEEENETSPDEEDVIKVNSNDPNVIEAKINPNWKPVGTSQTGEHITQYNQGATDWQEMLKAISYATNVDVGNMTVLWIGNGGEPNKNAVGTISTKDTGLIYRVYLDWVDGEGWKPTKLEQLKEFKK